LLILSLLAALALPRVYPGGGATVARATAYSVAALLRADRNAALGTGQTTTTHIDESQRTVSSGSGRGAVSLPEDLAISTRDVTDGSIRFSADGRSSGGAVVLSQRGSTFAIRVDPLTGGVTIADSGR
jgi:general secretion pathway protein H